MKFDCPSCGKTLNVKDEFAGKKARCPGCKETLTVPHASEAPAAAAPAAAAPAAAEPPAQVSACPNCSGALAEGAVFCVACGYDLRTGKKLKTVTGGDAKKKKEEAPGDKEEGYSRDERE